FPTHLPLHSTPWNKAHPPKGRQSDQTSSTSSPKLPPVRVPAPTPPPFHKRIGCFLKWHNNRSSYYFYPNHTDYVHWSSHLSGYVASPRRYPDSQVQQTFFPPLSKQKTKPN